MIFTLSFAKLFVVSTAFIDALLRSAGISFSVTSVTISTFPLPILTESKPYFMDFTGTRSPNLKNVSFFSLLVFLEPVVGNALTKHSRHIL